MSYAKLAAFYQGKRVFVTGHTGFKGSWLVSILKELGAEVCGYSLAPSDEPSLFGLLKLDAQILSIFADINDYQLLQHSLQAFKPELVFHLAAQALVRESYSDPVTSYQTNVMGTVHLLQAIRHTDSVRSVVNITTDKVYLNLETSRPYQESDRLDGLDPYSNSKSCSELVSSSFRRAFYAKGNGPALSCVRAGNVIGGGDFAKDRIIPDCVRAVTTGQTIAVRNPLSIRPYQHVLEPLSAYLLLAAGQYAAPSVQGVYNVGPKLEDCVSTADLVQLFCSHWGPDATWASKPLENAVHEASYLRLDSTLIGQKLGWKARWTIDEAVKKTVEWARACANDTDPSITTRQQIKSYFLQGQHD